MKLNTHQLVRAQAPITLLVFPETARQRAFWTVRADRTDQRAHALEKAREKFGPDVPFRWIGPNGEPF